MVNLREKEYLQALLEYQRRRRRFGRTDEQVGEPVARSVGTGGRQS